MKDYKFGQRLGFLSLTTMLITACSEISFSPSNDMGTTSSSEILADGSVKDTFVFNQNTALAKVDVLFISDNSASMAIKQTRLGNALDSFITSLGTVNWQIGVTTTDTTDGPFGLKGSLLTFDGTATNVLNSSVPNYSMAFLNTVQRPELGAGDERPIRATIQAIGKRSTDNAGFFRSDADLAVVMLTDEDEASNGNATANTPDSLIDAVESAFGPSKNITVYGIIIRPGDTACYDSQFIDGGKYANVIDDLVDTTGGVTGSICDLDYAPTLTTIGNRVKQGVRTAVLSQVPINTTIDLEISPTDPALTWRLKGRTIIFSKPPDKGSVITVIYRPL